MMMKTRLALSGILASVLAVPAFAGGLADPVVEPVIDPVPVEVAPVTGDWTGGYVGAQLGYGDVSVGDDDGDGAIYGLRAGYDYDFGNWVLGAGIGYDKTSIDLDAGAGEIDDIARLGFRAGADLGQTLIYGTAGLARASATVGGADLSDNGYYVGIGAEYMLNDSWTVGGELMTNQFDDFDDSGLDFDATTIAATVGFRF